MKTFLQIGFTCLFALTCNASPSLPFEETFKADALSSGTWQTFGRGQFITSNGVFSTTDGWAVGGSTNWSNYTLSFRARAPESSRQVQIWAGFRHFNRDYRYVVGLRGGNNNQLYLARYGAEGNDKMLDEIPLDFSPTPGTWYNLKVTVAGNDIAVYLNDEADPRILVQDENCPFQTGGISLGGSYLPTEFDDVRVVPVDAAALKEVKKRSSATISKEQNEAKRLAQRQAYRPFTVPLLFKARNEFSLNGNWLLIPENEATGKVAALDYDDAKAHVMDVPNFWVPFSAWLEGEK
ncbi:MAG: LamG domain-containing protein, partial [Kiritimatiellaceae bacterium]|nr:LamG domain-containing protein [Kiritimatiellaceae bacterium]